MTLMGKLHLSLAFIRKSVLFLVYCVARLHANSVALLKFTSKAALMRLMVLSIRRQYESLRFQTLLALKVSL